MIYTGKQPADEMIAGAGRFMKPAVPVPEDVYFGINLLGTGLGI